ITPVYAKPTLSGQLNFPDNHFDLITCFSALHHIPNVSYVMSELCRCLKPGGYLLMHEPIQSMGDWSRARRGLTKNERGIPLPIFRKIINQLNFIVTKETFCSSFIRKINRRFIYSNFYLAIDKIISGILSFEAATYHRKTLFSKLAPGAVYYILTK
ncbi:MAG: class I SAM-dependent methyltransferase, partial [Ginsengibacter sp.]